jgi:putative ABC transport system permease protein
MLTVALATIGSRRVSFAGATVAIALGVALVCSCGLLLSNVLNLSGAGRFADADLLVARDSAMKVGGGDTGSVVTVHPPPRIPQKVVGRVQSVPGVARAVGDLAFPAVAVAGSRVLSARGANRSEGHGWSSAALTPYRLIAGRAPRTEEIVVDERLAAGMRLGEKLQVAVPAGMRTFRISGIAASPRRADRGQSALFFSDEAAPSLAATPGQVNAVAVIADKGVDPTRLRSRIETALGRGYTVLPRRQAADVDAGDPRAQQRDDLIAYLGTMAALAAAVSLFIVAGTFALTIAQRRQGLALLRIVGASPGQLRRMVAAEALVVAVVGGVIGCIVGVALASPLAGALVDHGIAPDSLRASVDPIALVVALASGILVAEVAALASAERAARIRPAEALREAAIERRGLGLTRWLLGLAAIGGGVSLVALFRGGLALDFAEVSALLLAVGVALLAPVVLAWPARLLSLPLRLTAPGLLANAAIATERRRIGALAAPLVLIVSLAGTFVITDATSRAATQTASAARVRAADVLVAGTGPGLPLTAPGEARRLTPGPVGTIPVDVYLLDPGIDNFGSPWPGVALDGTVTPGLLDLGVREGSLSEVRGDGVAISTAVAGRRLRPGAELHARFADTRPATLHVVAVYDHATGFGDIVLSRQLAVVHAPVLLESAVFMRDPASSVVRELARAFPTSVVLTRAHFLAALKAATKSAGWAGWLLVALVTTFAGLAIVNTSLIALIHRRPELVVLRSIGAAPGQAWRQLDWESLVTTVVGVAAGALVVVVAVSRVAQRPGWHISVPSGLVALTLGGAAALGLVSMILPARLLARASIVKET